MGLACAWELHRAGADVVVLEREAVGSGVSWGNAGWVCPSIAFPLPAPGMVREGLRQLVTGGGAFVLRPTLDGSFLRWLWRFGRNCSRTRFEAGAQALAALNRRTFELYDAYRAAGIPFEMQSSGLIVASRTRADFDHYRLLFGRLEKLGCSSGPVEELDGPTLAALEPALAGTRGVRALHAHVDRFVRPEQLTAGLAARLRTEGVEIQEHCGVRWLGRDGDSLGLETPRGRYAADRVVIAAGLASAGLLPDVGRRIPLAGARGYSVTMAGDGSPPRRALYLSEARLAVTPFEGGVRIAGVFELGARTAKAPANIADRLAAAARPYLAGWLPEVASSREPWAGLRPVTPDGLPLIGATPGLEHVYVATGHGMLGVTLAPATAAVLAPLVLEGRSAPELAPFAPARRA